MVQRGENLGITAEPRTPVRILRERVGENLQRDVTTELGVAGAIHVAHAATAKE
jgi:hypothetical protein